MLSTWQWPWLKALARNAVALEGGLDAVTVHSRRRGRNHFCRPLPAGAIREYLDRVQNLQAFLSVVNPGDDDDDDDDDDGSGISPRWGQAWQRAGVQRPRLLAMLGQHRPAKMRMVTSAAPAPTPRYKPAGGTRSTFMPCGSLTPWNLGKALCSRQRAAHVVCWVLGRLLHKAKLIAAACLPQLGTPAAALKR